MDLTSDYYHIASSYDSSVTHNHHLNHTDANPFTLKANDIYSKLLDFEDLLFRVYEDFVDLHRFLPSESTYHSLKLHGGDTRVHAMTELERKELSDEIVFFQATVASALKDLKYLLSLRPLNRMSKVHCQEIISFLSSRLELFSKQSKMMHKEKEKISVKPYEFFSNEFTTFGDHDDDNLLVSTKQSDENEHSFASLFDNKKEEAKKHVDDKKRKGRINKAFLEKLDKAAAPSHQIEKYNALAEKHKKVLMKEAKGMQTKFSEELVQAHQMESSISQIGSMLTEFVSILQDQSELVGDVHEDAKQTTETVKGSGGELQLTIERSENSGKSIILLSIGLGILLLLLDYAHS